MVIKKNKEQVQPIVNLKNISPQTESVTLTADKTLPNTVLNKEQQNQYEQPNESILEKQQQLEQLFENILRFFLY